MKIVPKPTKYIKYPKGRKKKRTNYLGVEKNLFLCFLPKLKQKRQNNQKRLMNRHFREAIP